MSACPTRPDCPVRSVTGRSRPYRSGCGDYVPRGELRWVETGQDLESYNAVLRAAATPELRARAHEHFHGRPA